MHRAIAFIGAVTFLTCLTSAVQAAPIGSSADLQGLQERSVNTSNVNSSSDSSSNTINTPTSTDAEGKIQIDKKVQVLVRPEKDNSGVGVYPTDNTSTGNQFQVLYQIDE